MDKNELIEPKIETKELKDLNNSFVINRDSLIVTLTDITSNGKAQVFYRTHDNNLHPVGVALKRKGFETVIELTDIGTAKKLMGIEDDRK